MRSNKSKIKQKVSLITTVLLAVVLLLTISYAAFSDQLTITNIVSRIRVYKIVRINGVTTASGAVSDLDYNTNSVLNYVSIPAGESITYTVTVTNLGNVPQAVSDVSFTNPNGTVSGLTANITPSSYVKICNTNNECANGVFKDVTVTITNTTSSTISTKLDVNLTFTDVYDISYEGNKVGEALAGADFSYIFNSNPPARLAKASGTCGSFNYANNTLTVNNVGSNLNFIEAHTINYNGAALGYIIDGGTYTYTFESEWPATVVKDSGTADSFNYQAQTHTITITNVKSDISLTGTIGKVEITSITYVQNSAKNVLNNPIPQPTFHDMNAQFSITFERPEGSTETDFEISYQVTISNTHYNDYIFRGLDFHPTISASAGSDTATLELIPSGIANGDVIASGSSRTFTVKLKLTPSNPDGSYGTSGQTQVDTTPDTEEETGTITATINQTTGDLRSQDGFNNSLAQFTLTVTSTYPSAKEFKLSLSNSNLEVVDSSGNALGNLTIHAEDTEQYMIYIKGVTGATFQQNTATTNLYLGITGSANILVDGLTLTVNIYNVPDTTPITVGDVQISMHRASETSAPTEGQIDVKWERRDKGGDRVTDWYLQLYNSSNTLVDTGHITVAAPREYSFTGVADGTYKVVVYGVDAHPNSGASYASASTTTADGYASASSQEPFDWRFSVDVSGVDSKLSVAYKNNETIPKLEQSFTIYLNGGGSAGNDGSYYIAPAAGNNLKVYMNNELLSVGDGDDQYKYSRGKYNNGNDNTQGIIEINKVTGDIKVEATAGTDGGCLIEGTKILLANGKYKNVENIDYDDLLLVYNHETGKLVPEYPIWLKQSKVTNSYQRTTFSDGSVLDTYTIHGMFDPNLNRFVDVTNRDEFHEGTKVVKLKDDLSGFTTVTVTKIENIHEPANYYHVVTTNYFNNIANGLFVSDGHVNLLNRYGFSDDMIWNKEVLEYARQDVYQYEELQDVLPRHLFEGTMAKEAKILTQSGYGLEEFRSFIEDIAGDMMKTPMQKFGRNVWMVTTSEDNVTDLNKSNYLQYEGTEFILPKSKKNNLIGWLNTSDNKIYLPGDTITIYHGTHFEAIYK